MENIRARGRLIVGLDIGSNLFSFRDPITGEITGFDVDIAGEIARDIFGTPSQVEYRILSSADRIAALQNNQVDVVVKTMTITCERKKLVNFSTVYFNANQRILAPRDSTISAPSDLSGKRVCVAKGTTSLQRIQQITPPPIIVGVVTWADCLVALQQRQVDAVSTDDSILAGLVRQDPYLHIVGPSLNEEPYGIGINLQNTGLVRFVNGTLERMRRDGTWNTLVPQVVNGARPGTGTASREVFRLMAEMQRDTNRSPKSRRWGPSRPPGRPRAWTRSPPCARWQPRPCSGRTSTTSPTASRSAPATPNPRTTRPRRGRCRRLAVSAVAWWRSRGCRRRIRSKR